MKIECNYMLARIRALLARGTGDQGMPITPYFNDVLADFETTQAEGVEDALKQYADRFGKRIGLIARESAQAQRYACSMQLLLQADGIIITNGGTYRRNMQGSGVTIGYLWSKAGNEGIVVIDDDYNPESGEAILANRLLRSVNEVLYVARRRGAISSPQQEIIRRK